MTRVLIGEISSYKAIVICKFIREHYPDARIITFDYLSFTRTVKTKYSDEHHILKKTSIEAYINLLSALCKTLSVDVFLPVHSDLMEHVIRARAGFGRTLDYLGSLEDYQKLHDKKQLAKIARNLKIPVPLEYASFREAVPPFVIKPTNLSSSKGVSYIRDTQQKDNFKKKGSTNILFQELVEGVGCGYSVYAKNGAIQTGYGHTRLAEYPVSGGSSVYRTAFFLPEMQIIAKQILNEVKWTGFAMFEFKYTPDKRLVLIEVNPRIWGSVNQGLQNGVNYFDTIIPEAVATKKPDKDVNTYLSPQLHLSLFKYLLKGKTAPLKKFLSDHNRKADVSLLGDPGGWMSIILRNFFR